MSHRRISVSLIACFVVLAGSVTTTSAATLQGGAAADPRTAARDAAQAVIGRAAVQRKELTDITSRLRPSPSTAGKNLAVAEALLLSNRSPAAFSALRTAVSAGLLNPAAYDDATRMELHRILAIAARGNPRQAADHAARLAEKNPYGATAYVAGYTAYADGDIAGARFYWASSVLRGETGPLLAADGYPAIEYSALRLLAKTAK